ncbi:MAG: hypothetical protein K2M00_09170 [Muribaculaceae bacterium]|nr:hypothetical protein [Muribaculaceae bacterium]
MRVRQLFIFLFTTLAFSLSATGSDSTAQVNYKPELGGVIRVRWEMKTHGGYNRFAVPNARVNLRGNIARPVDYFVQVDLSQSGKFAFLDAWARLTLLETLKIRVGRFRIPFGIDPFRAPGNYIFANRSFIGRDIANNRDIGVEASYSLPIAPLTLEAGVFNPHISTDDHAWTRDKVFASRAVYQIGDFRLAAGYQSIVPDSIRINMADVTVTYTAGRWLAEAEYMYEHYTGDAFDNCHAYNFFASYSIPVKVSVFDDLSVQARFDGTTPHSTGYRNDAGRLVANSPARNRVTVGSTLSYRYKRLRCAFHLNYEKYFYHRGTAVPVDRDDKITAEVVVTF